MCFVQNERKILKIILSDERLLSQRVKPTFKPKNMHIFLPYEERAAKIASSFKTFCTDVHVTLPVALDSNIRIKRFRCGAKFLAKKRSCNVD